MNKIDLENYNLTELTEEQLKSLCQLNNIEPEKLIKIDLSGNNIINLDFIQENTPFINLKSMDIYSNYELKDLTNIKYLKNSLEELSLMNCRKLKNLNDLKDLKKLKILNMNFTYLNEKNNEIVDLINSLNLHTFYCIGLMIDLNKIKKSVKVISSWE